MKQKEKPKTYTPLTEEAYDRYMQAGSVAAQVLEESKELVKVDASLLMVANALEEMIYEAGMKTAFPVNISLNADAAHDTPSPDDIRIFAREDVVKIDIGVHLDGYIADTALTIDLSGEHELLVEAAVAARDAAIAVVKPGIQIGILGEYVAKEIMSRGFKPIHNLTGHGVDRYVLHMPPNVPNIPKKGGIILEEGMVFAIEPFASTGAGNVTDKNRIEIFSEIASRPVRSPSARSILKEINPRRGMPFARRQLQNYSELGLTRLFKDGILHGYPVLSDEPGSFVSQSEHTVIVTEDGCIVTTSPGTARTRLPVSHPPSSDD
ncbi:MAG: type II methionyl aminopeptidase [Methanomicrobiales archaeon]|jgi:methionyl aminopeptidase|nr:type II methionyl aminopeptidase [Methanomicrobiales archaeon]